MSADSPASAELDPLALAHLNVIGIAAALESLRLEYESTTPCVDAVAETVPWLEMAALTQADPDALDDLLPFVSEQPIELETACGIVEFEHEPGEGEDARAVIAREVPYVATPASWHHHVVAVAEQVLYVLREVCSPETCEDTDPKSVVEAAAVAIDALRLPDAQRLDGRLQREFFLARQRLPAPSGPRGGDQTGDHAWGWIDDHFKGKGNRLLRLLAGNGRVSDLKLRRALEYKTTGQCEAFERLIDRVNNKLSILHPDRAKDLWHISRRTPDREAGWELHRE